MIQESMEKCHVNVARILVGHILSDDPSQVEREVSFDQGKSVAEDYGMHYWEITL